MGNICNVDKTQFNASTLRQINNTLKNANVTIGTDVSKVLKSLLQKSDNADLYKSLIHQLEDIRQTNPEYLTKSQLDFINTYTEESIEQAIQQMSQQLPDKVLTNPTQLGWLKRPIGNIFGLAKTSEQYLRSSFRAEIFKAIYLNNYSIRGLVTSITTANNNLEKYINNLLETVQDGLNFSSNNKFKLSFEDDFETKYTNLLIQAVDYIQSNIDLSQISSKSDVQNLDFVNAVVILSKFDELLQEEFGNLVSIPADSFGYFTKVKNKYSIVENPVKMAIYQEGDESRFIASNTQSNFFKLWAGTIPKFDSNNKIMQGQFLTANEIQSTLGVLSREFIKYYIASKGKVLSFSSDAENTLNIIFSDEYFKELVQNNSVLRSLKNYLYIDDTTEGRFSLKTLLDKYRADRDVTSSELNLFNILAFEAAKSNSPVLYLTEVNKKGIVKVKDLNLSSLQNAGKLRHQIKLSIAQDISQKIDNPFKKYYVIDVDGNKTLLSDFNLDSTFFSTTVYNVETNEEIGLEEIFSQLYNVPEKEFKKYISKGKFAASNLKKVATLVGNINSQYLNKFKSTNEDDLYTEIKLTNEVQSIGTGIYSNDEIDVKMITYNGNKDAIPVNRMYSPMFSALNFIHDMKQRFGDNASIYTKYINLFTDENNAISDENTEGYVTNIGVNVDAVGKMYKVAQSFTPKESVYHEVVNGFINQFNRGLFTFQPVAYSDKSTIFNLIVNLKCNIGNTTFGNLKISELEKEYYQVQKAFYDKVKETILSNWSKVFKVELKSLDELEDQFAENRKEAIELGISEKRLIQNKIAEAFYTDNTLEIVEERDFSLYKGEFHVNKTFKYHADLYSEDTPTTQWKQDQLNNYISFVKFIQEQKINFGSISIDKLKQILGTDFNQKQFENLYDEEGNLANKIPINEISSTYNGTKVNILLYKYLIMKNMFTDSWLNMSVGHPWIHKSKGKNLNKEIKNILEAIKQSKDLNQLTFQDIQDFYQGNKDITGSEKTYLFDEYNKLLQFAQNKNINLNDVDLDSVINQYNLYQEVISRNNTSQKRNNSFTATSELYLVNGANTISKNINAAIVTDHEAETFNLSGSYGDDLEAQNGSIFAPGFVSAQMENALPARGQRGVQKNIFLHTGLGYSTQIKDAQQIISNELIRMTAYDTTGRKINYKKMLYKMCEHQDFSNIDISKINTDPSIIANQDLYYVRGGRHFRINELFKNEFGSYTINVTEVNKQGNELNNTFDIQQNINNLYDLWQALGGEYSETLEDGELVLSEDSMYAVSNYINQVKEGNTKLLEQKLIHLLLYKSAVKMGPVNVNWAKDVLYNDSTKKLMYFKMSLQYSGLQNDKNHHVDEDNIREMSQVISALAQGNETMYIAQQAYKDIAKFTKARVGKFSKLYKLNISEHPDEFYETVAKFIVKSFQNADHISGGIAIAEMMQKNKLFITSDSQIYNKFVSSFISELNNSAIKRKYTGLAGILCPSDGAIQVLEKDGITYLVSDVMRAAVNQISDPSLSNEELIKRYIDENFTDIEITQDDIKLEDTIKIVNSLGEVANQVKITNPFLLQEWSESILPEGSKILKVRKASRDLKPAEHTWKMQGKQYNIWTCPLVTLNLKLNQTLVNKGMDGQVKKDELGNNDYKYEPITDDFGNVTGIALLSNNQFATDGKFVLTDDETNIFLKLKSLGRLSQLQQITQTYTISLQAGHAISDGNWGNALDILMDTSYEVLNDNNTNPLELIDANSYTFTEAECILPDVYFQKLGTKGHTISEILSKGPDFFKQGVSSKFNAEIKKSDLVINTDEKAYGVIIANEEQIRKSEIFTIIENDIRTYKDSYGDVWATDEEGDKKYQLIDGVKRVYDNQTGTEYILINVETAENQKSLTKLIESFEDVISVIPKFESYNYANIRLYNTVFRVCKNVNDKELSQLFKECLNILDKGYESDSPKWKDAIKNSDEKTIKETNKTVSKEVKKYFTNTFAQFLPKYIDKLSKERYTTFKYIQHILSARIPAQSLQSFMTMKNVGFTQNQLNNIYVSRWQIWIQGSDFDIDVAYNLMYSISEMGRLCMSSPLANLTSENLLERSKTLQRPNGNIIYNENSNKYINKNVTVDNANKIFIISQKGNKFLLQELKSNDSVKKFLSQINYSVLASRETSAEKSILILTDSPIKGNSYSRSELISKLPQFKVLKGTFLTQAGVNITSYINEWYEKYDSLNEEDQLRVIDIYKEVLDIIDQNFQITIDDTVINPEAASEFIDLLNKHNYSRVSKNALKNNILDNARKVSNDIRNMIASYMSVDGGQLSRIKELMQQLGLETSLGEMHDGSFIFKMQEANYVGKKTVGIYANAIKGYFALKSYYDATKKIYPLLRHITLPISTKHGKRIVNQDCTKLAGSHIGDSFETILTLSALLTLATDNAKELGLAKINAGLEFAGSYAYLTVLGVDIKDQIEFFTSPIIKQVCELVKGNVFENERKLGIPTAIKKLREQLSQQMLDNEGNAQVLDELAFQDKQLIALNSIYESAQEFRAFTSILGINQGIKNTSNELIIFKQNFTDQFMNRFNKFFNKNREKFVKILLDRNSYQTKESIEKIIDTAIKHNVLNKDMMFKNVDFNTFFINESYQKAVINLYELIKDTFNIYECFTNATLFQTILTETAEFDEIMQKASNKHRISSNLLSKIIAYNKPLPKNATVGQKALKSFDIKQIGKVQDLVEHKLITSWLKTSKMLDKFQFNKATLLRLVGNSVSSEDNVNFNLKTPDGIMMFKSMMESVIIPLVLKQDSQFKDNEFVNRLILYRDNFKDDQWYKLNVNLQYLNTGTSQEINQELVDGYNDLRHKKSPIPSLKNLQEFTWGELLYVYNMIANKNKFGPQRMSAIFEQQIMTDVLAQDYLHFASDQEKKTMDVSYDELLYALYAENNQLELEDVVTGNQVYTVEETEEPEQTSQDNDLTEADPKEEKETPKKIESVKYILKNNYGGQGFLNFFEKSSSQKNNTEVELNEIADRYELYKFLLNSQALIRLNCQ